MKQTALVTGGNKGIGLEVTRYLLARGFNVIVIARDFSDFEFSDHEYIECIRFDLTEIEAIPQLIASLEPIDVLVNNAGIMHACAFDEYSPEQQQQIMRLNLEAPVALIREVSKSMMAKGEGRIVNNASIAGQIGHPDIWYGISKAGLINVTKSFSKLLGPSGVLVNAVAVSPTETEMLYTIPLHRREAFLQTTINQRFATAKEVAETIGWLCTDSPAYMNGACLDLNNGSFPR